MGPGRGQRARAALRRAGRGPGRRHRGRAARPLLRTRPALDRRRNARLKEIEVMAVRRHAIVGLGSRAQLFARALAASPRAGLAAFCDHNETRMRVHNGWLGTEIPGYRPADFAAMLAKEHIDVVVVCTPDHTHADYVVAALEAGCDVVTEKPMTTDVGGARRILAARRETGGSVRVAFN